MERAFERTNLANTSELVEVVVVNSGNKNLRGVKSDRQGPDKNLFLRCQKWKRITKHELLTRRVGSNILSYIQSYTVIYNALKLRLQRHSVCLCRGQAPDTALSLTQLSQDVLKQSGGSPRNSTFIILMVIESYKSTSNEMDSSSI